jgi:hypothetical protein
MERNQERPEVRFGDAAAAMAATAALWSLLHRLAQGCACCLGLAHLTGDYSLEAPVATSPQCDVSVSSDYEPQKEENKQEVVEVQSRSMVLKKNTKVNQGVGDGGIIY